MTAETALPDVGAKMLRQILDDPWNDHWRLGYADWLEENGRPERAEFIRVQCELTERDRQRAAGIQNSDIARVMWLHDRERGLADTLGLTGLGLVGLRDALNNASVEVGGRLIWHGAQFNKLTVRRGFVAEVTCTTADWCGGRCGNCDGFGHTNVSRDLEPSDTLWEGYECVVCSGTGQRPVLGPALVLAQPVTGVRLNHQTPARSREYPGEWFWAVDGGYPEGVDRKLWDRLSGFSNRFERNKYYPTQAAALDALSRAAVSWARAEAGLPELDWPN